MIITTSPFGLKEKESQCRDEWFQPNWVGEFKCLSSLGRLLWYSKGQRPKFAPRTDSKSNESNGRKPEEMNKVDLQLAMPACECMHMGWIAEGSKERERIEGLKGWRNQKIDSLRGFQDRPWKGHPCDCPLRMVSGPRYAEKRELPFFATGDEFVSTELLRAWSSRFKKHNK